MARTDMRFSPLPDIQLLDMQMPYVHWCKGLARSLQNFSLLARYGAVCLLLGLSPSELAARPDATRNTPAPLVSTVHLSDTLPTDTVFDDIPTPSNGALPRIVSASLCGDYYLLALADHQQIVALSALARDADMSLFADRAQSYAQFDGRLENLLQWNADLVIVSAYTPKSRRDLMEKLGYRLFVLDGAQSLDETRREARRLGQAIGRGAYVEKWLVDLDTAIAQLPRPTKALRLLAYDRRGVTAGAGHLIDDMIRLLGHENAAAARIANSQPLSLEHVLTLSPDLVLLSGHRTYADRGSEILDHAGFVKALPPERRIHLAAFWTHCAGPSLVPALQHLITEISKKMPVYPELSAPQ